ncbi:hypothetical protein [Oleiharenicola sp. Vm1]|uniref:hypothetical protein n=1 Tax=Oleiharenicola sp. Vm1 TaxID=3398393 RepID=UPI0039F58D30
MTAHHFTLHEVLHSRSLALRVSTVLFGLFALGHLGRLLVQPEVRIAGHTLPLWTSVLAMLLGAALAAWVGSLAFRKTEKPAEPPAPVSDR